MCQYKSVTVLDCETVIVWDCDTLIVWQYHSKKCQSVTEWQFDSVVTVWKYYSNKSVKVRQNDSVIGKTK